MQNLGKYNKKHQILTNIRLKQAHKYEEQLLQQLLK